jgi:SAM-dependent methyltransferase
VTAPNDYDTFARAYAAHNDNGSFNAGYERPAVLAMVGDVDGKRVLDAGCGSGSHATELVARGARVTGLDTSAGLLEIAAERLGPRVALHRADLADPLPFADASFDVVLASLVMHYLQDWVPTLAEFRRVLVPGGRLVFSTHHPSMPHPEVRDRYFDVHEIVEEWNVGGQQMQVRFWHRPLRAMIAAIADAGLSLTTLDEPDPQPAVEQRDPRGWRLLTTAPRFLFVVAAAPSGRPEQPQ